jgi:hypothetical protein
MCQVFFGGFRQISSFLLLKFGHILLIGSCGLLTCGRTPRFSINLFVLHLEISHDILSYLTYESCSTIIKF